MKNHLLTCKVACKGMTTPVFEGKDIFLEITLTNVSTANVGFPVAYVQKTGPAVKLTAKSTKQEVYLKTNLADPAMMNQFTEIAPGKSVTIEWLITAAELEQYGGSPTDVAVEVTILTKVKFEGAIQDFRCDEKFQIVGKDAVRP